MWGKSIRFAFVLINLPYAAVLASPRWSVVISKLTNTLIEATSEFSEASLSHAEAEHAECHCYFSFFIFSLSLCVLYRWPWVLAFTLRVSVPESSTSRRSYMPLHSHTRAPFPNCRDEERARNWRRCFPLEQAAMIVGHARAPRKQTLIGTITVFARCYIYIYIRRSMHTHTYKFLQQGKRKAGQLLRYVCTFH